MIDPRLRDDAAQLHARLCSGLADPTRILLIYALAECPRNVSELAEILDLPQPTISRHLKELRDRRIVTFERQAQSVIYDLRDRRIIAALDMLRELLRDMLAGDAEIVMSAQSNE